MPFNPHLPDLETKIDEAEVLSTSLQSKLAEAQSTYASFISTNLVTESAPVWSSGTISKLFGIAVVDDRPNGAARTTRISSLVDFIQAARCFNAVQVYCDATEVAVGTIPNYIDDSGMVWIATGLERLYASLTTTQFNTYITNCEARSAFGYVIENAETLTPTEVQNIVTQIEVTTTSKPIIAQFPATTTVSSYQATTPHVDAYLREYHRQGTETVNVKYWWSNHTPHDIISLECFSTGVTLTQPHELREMFNYLQAEGNQNYIVYAASDLNTDLTAQEALWTMLQGLGVAYWLSV